MNLSTQDLTSKEHYERYGYFVVKKFIPTYFAEFLREYFNTLKNTGRLTDGDEQSRPSACVYGDPCFDTVMLMSTGMISNTIGIDLLPTYTYARIYYNGAKLLPHLDRPECEHSATLFLGSDSDISWPIWMYRNHEVSTPKSIELDPGDAVVYKGCENLHWRDTYSGDSHYQIFMHYVNKNGPFADKVFDSRPYVGVSSS